MKLIQIFFSPIGFAIGFLTPLLGQVLTHFNVIDRWELAYAIGFVIALSFGLIAQFRGSWIWLR
tara:strand:- start:926 stop:1117 length:192 start_codon:yes stop_codon:yes gene_type:complete